MLRQETNDQKEKLLPWAVIKGTQVDMFVSLKNPTRKPGRMFRKTTPRSEQNGYARAMLATW